MEERVYLKCIKEKSKLRVKIVSPGYFSDSNCQFPRDLRVDGRIFSVPSSAISLTSGPRGKFFYRVAIHDLQYDHENSSSADTAVVKKVYDDDTVTDCTICLCVEKSIVFAPCGHHVSCHECSIKIKTTTGKCPICRTAIGALVKREDVQ